MEKILLDTDIGTDIDDAICLAYLLANPVCELMGISTVSGEPEKRAMIASALCKIAGQDIPIFPGLAHPVLTPIMQDEAQQAEALAHWPHEQTFPRNKAIPFLMETIHKHPGEITLLGIGAMTNIATLFTLDPEIPSLLKGLVLMCGLFQRRLGRLDPLEWNARQDPYATAIVYNHQVAVHRSIGADVTHDIRMGKQEVMERFAQHDLLRPVLDFARIWFEDRDEVIFHDPLAAATIFDERICGLEQGSVEVELQSSRLLGYTHWLPEPFAYPGQHQIATSADKELFFDTFFSTFV